jgi:hypothetical protein
LRVTSVSAMLVSLILGTKISERGSKAETESVAHFV